MRGSITQGKACEHKMGTDRGSISRVWLLVPLLSSSGWDRRKQGWAGQGPAADLCSPCFVLREIFCLAQLLPT